MAAERSKMHGYIKLRNTAAPAKYRKQSGQKLIGFVKVSTALSFGNCRSRLHLQRCIHLLADFIISMSSLYVLSGCVFHAFNPKSFSIDDFSSNI